MANEFSLLTPDLVRDVNKHGTGVLSGFAATKFPFSHYNNERSLCVAAPSVNAFLDFLVAEHPAPRSSRYQSSIQRGDNDFRLLPSYEEATRIFRRSPREIRQFVVNERDMKLPDYAGNEVQYAQTGDFLDVGRVLEDNPECFGNVSMGNPSGIFANIVTNLSATWNFGAEALAERGRRLVRMVDWLESMQVRTAIRAFACNECAYVEIIVKDFHEPVDLNAVAVIGHPDFFRRHIFRVVENSPTVSGGYGTATIFREGRMEVPELNYKNLTIFCETFETVDATTIGWDEAEREVEAALESGEFEARVFV
jgi:hypothetical protein